MNDAVELGKVSFKIKALRAVWLVVSAFLFRPLGTKVFNPMRLFLLKIFGADVQWDSGVYSSSQIWAPWNLKMGHNAWLGPNTVCYNQALVTIEDNVTVSQYSYLCTAGHRIDIDNVKEAGLIVSPILLRKGCWVGARAYISMGVIIGEGAIVGATASVFKDVEPWTVVGGNPAKILKKRVLAE